MEKRVARGNIEIKTNPRGFEVHSWGEKTQVLFLSKQKKFIIDQINTKFSEYDREEITENYAQSPIQKWLGNTDNTQTKNQEQPSLTLIEKIVAFSNILNYVKFHSKALIKQRKSEDFSLQFAEKIAEGISSRRGLVYQFQDDQEEFVATYLRTTENKKKDSNVIPSHFSFYCPTRAQRQAVIDYLNSLVPEWTEQIQWEK
jgi:hypothetical protein